MKDFDRLRIRFKQFGGWRLAWEYVRMGLLWVIIKELFRCVIHRRSFKTIYPAISRVVDPMLVEKYRPRPSKSPLERPSRPPLKGGSFPNPLERSKSPFKERPSKPPLKGGLLPNSVERTKSPFKGDLEGPEGPYIWSCWLQGWDNAPELAKACLASLKRNLTDVEIVELDERNYTQWVTLPDYIVEKYRKGRIPPAMFSDMLRLQLLAEHGGVWIDSTVLYTGTSGPSRPSKSPLKGDYHPSWEDIINADLFVFQYTKPGHRWSGSLSNWFIASKKGNPFIITLRDMLFAYWRDYDVALEYYICHLFFNEVAKIYPEQIAKMPYGWSMPSISLGAHLHYRFKEEKWQQLTNQVHWHKMSYRKEKELRKDPDNYYNYIIKTQTS